MATSTDGNAPNPPSVERDSIAQPPVLAPDNLEREGSRQLNPVVPVAQNPSQTESANNEPPTTGTPAGEGTLADTGAAGPPSQQKSGKPQVIVRIRPSPNVGNNLFEVDVETKTIQIRVDRDHKSQDPKSRLHPSFIYFPADNVLENSSQDDTFNVVASEIVEKAMQGTPGMIVAVGPEVSGKTFSLFGLSGRYRNRGIIARSLEKLFEIKDRKKEETDFKFGIGIIEVRREKIRDLLTLGPYEINDVGDRGPKGMYIEEVDCLEHGLGLLLRALIGQKLIHQEAAFERFHTIVYMDIVAISPTAPDLIQFYSRITFAEIASAPDQKSDLEPSFSGTPMSTDNCAPPPPPKIETKFKTKQGIFPSRRCCNPGYTSGPLAESIAVRRDIFALEQIFLKANEMQKIKKYFAKLEELGLAMIASEKRRYTTGHNVRQNKLAHCLKDILDGVTEIRILLHVRPDKAYLRSSLEAMRFAERARLVPANLDGGSTKRVGTGLGRTEDQILHEVITNIAPDLMNSSNVENLTNEKMKGIQEQAVRYFENNIDSMKICSKEKVKLMFENFRVLWNFLWELELNVSLRKAQEDMKLALAAQASSAAWTVAGDDDDGLRNQSNANLVNKKSTMRRMKKEKAKKKKDKKRESMEFKVAEEKRPSTQPNVEGQASSGEGGEARKLSGSGGSGKGEEKKRSLQPPGVPGQEQEGGDGIQVTFSATNVVPFEGEPPPPTEPIPQVVAPPSTPGEEQKRESSVLGAPRSQAILVERQASTVKGIGGSLPVTPVIQGGEEGGAVATPSGVLPTDSSVGGEGAQEEVKVSSEEERAALAAKLEQQISSNFEEMKKIARRQAFHLLRAGVKRPQWMSLF
ncbi:Kinesin-like protein KLP1 [Orchesella cincta]|uniref:Kinesin-like protein KLP1 n=1 Tax=Orchesella cincta TaxID=48709 RepID=A0A1D2MA84_ORCCI|nr:Kinesin-like protein KLP1 [Orchesella cincta]